MLLERNRDPGEAIVEHEPLDAGEEPEEADTGAGVGPGCESPEGHLLVVRRASTQ